MEKEIHILTNTEEKGKSIIDESCDNECLFFSSAEDLKNFILKQYKKQNIMESK